MEAKEREAVLLDYQKTLEFLNKMDNVLYQVRNWTVVACSAVISFGVSKNSVAILGVNALVVICFLFIELTYKSFHEDGVGHSYALEEIIHNDTFDLPTSSSYVFGIGHAIKPVQLRHILRIVTHKSRWHIQVFYLIILLLTVATGVLIHVTRSVGHQ